MSQMDSLKKTAEQAVQVASKAEESAQRTEIRALPAFKDLKFIKSANPELSRRLITFEEKSIFLNYKIGVLYCGPSQNEENAIFSNLSGSAEYEAFLEFLGDRIALQGWTKYRAGLDVKSKTSRN
eukprot:m51a1_g3827 putative domain-containing protein (125) ;mRNA; f:302623-305878